MQATNHSKIEFGLSGVQLGTDLTGGQDRPLGRAYRLILSCEPKTKAAAQGEIGEATPRPDDAKSAGQ